MNALAVAPCVALLTTAALAAPAAGPDAEPLRPQFHFTSATDWINDPNGLVYFDGEYHLFAQRNPGSREAGPGIAWRSWAHAVSPDLVHWTQLDDAIKPGDAGSVWSGSAVVDHENTAGFGRDALVAFYTNAKEPFDQRLVYSTDRGRTWTPYAGNPVVKNIHRWNRDPKVVWHAAGRQWVMALYLDTPHAFVLLASPDLKQWHELHRLTLNGDDECPDFFPIALDGKEEKWVFTAANGRYVVGRFDGKAFTPETDVLTGEYGPNFYAAQTFSNLPDGRRVQIGWMRDGQYPGMPFNQQLSFPCELTLRSTPRGPRLFRWPVKDVERLYGEGLTLHAGPLALANAPVVRPGGDLLDLSLAFEFGQAEAVTLDVRGHRITVRAEGPAASIEAWDRRVALPPNGGRVSLRVLVDRTSIEVFAADGEVVLSGCFLPPPDRHGITFSSAGDGARLISFVLNAVNSARPTVTP